MVCFVNNKVAMTTLKKATSKYNHISKGHYLIDTARKMGVSFGDD